MAGSSHHATSSATRVLAAESEKINGVFFRRHPEVFCFHVRD
jgi:hypothetical protein